MIRSPLPFVLAKKKPKLPKTISEQRTQGRKLMTLVAALSGHEGIAMFADTQETVAGYSKRIVDKLHVFDLPGAPFKFGIAGATNDATYVDMLQSELVAALSSVAEFDLTGITGALTTTLTEFYPKHIWPRSTDRPQMEYLIAIQPLPEGRPEIFHISETAANVVGITTHHKSIGVGAYLADYLLDLTLGGGEGLFQLASGAIYVAQEVRENIDGVGQVERIALFDCNGGYDELDMVDIIALEQNLRPLNEVMGSVVAALDISENKETLEAQDEEITDMVRGMREAQADIYDKWRKRKDGRARLLEMYAKRGRFRLPKSLGG